MFERIKEFLSDDTIFFGLLLLFVGSVSFGLGAWSGTSQVSNNQAAVISVEHTAPHTTYTSEDTEVTRDVTRDEQQATYVGSKNGSKYHLPWCPGAQQMKEENKIWFTSKEEAELSGYTPAGNCKGL